MKTGSRTPDHINMLPKARRDFIHELPTRTDPASDLQTIASLKDQVSQMQKQIQVLKAKIRQLEKKTSATGRNKS
jgi:predicted  nucleic acid-binding Zn-ribbon protein